MTKLDLRCFGSFEAFYDNTLITGFPTDKTRALLAYLAVESGQPHRRETLAALFWPDLPHTTAMTNLRVCLYRLRQTVIHAAPDADAALNLITRHTLQLDPNALNVDVIGVRTLLTACAAHRHPQDQLCDACLARLTEVVDLYRGEFLSGLAVEDAPAFDEWLLVNRENFHQQVMAAFASLIDGCTRRGDDAQAHVFASRQLALDPLREESHRQVMRVLARRGLKAEALAQYEQCRQLLHTELGVAPEDETTRLADQIRQGAFKAQAAEPIVAADVPPLATVKLSPLQVLDGTPEIAKIFGRSAELAQLSHWLVQDRCRLVALLGLGGVGKTTLAAAAARVLIDHFDRVLWYSVLNAPPPSELLRDLLLALDDHRVFDLPESFESRLKLLIEHLRRQRCLIIFDNLESILQPEQPGQMRPGYEGYAQLMRRVVESSHQSSLLITSRERPLGLARSEEDSPLVRSLPLYGLRAESGQAMLAARGIVGPGAVTSDLVARYSGNPLALKLVAQTVQELFAGDVVAFLAVDAPIFDDIRILLGQQLDRLSTLERELLIWLAIEREPMTFQSLRDNLVQPGAPRTVLEALRALQRRSLIEPGDQGFGLQNVVIEFLTDFLVERIEQEIAGDLPAQALADSFLNRFALLKATAKEYVRASQERLILQPLAHLLLDRFGRARLALRLQEKLAALRSLGPTPGYAAGNILNLLLHMGIDVRGYDFSRLTVRQAFLQGKQLTGVNFRGANLARSVFTYAFGNVLGIQFAADGQLLAAGVSQNQLCVWRVQVFGAGDRLEEQLLHTFHTPGIGNSMLSFSPSGRLLATGDTDFRVRVWDGEGGHLLHTLPVHSGGPWALAFSPDEQWLASSEATGVIHLWNLRSGVHTHTFREHTASVPALSFGPDGQTLASGDVDGVVCVWQNVTGSPILLHKSHEHSDEVHTLLFDATGTVLATGSHDRTIRLWDVRRGEVIHILHGHKQMIRTFAISPDNRVLASGGGDGFVCVWDLPSGQLLHTLYTQEYGGAYLSFSIDGQVLASIGRAHSIILFEIPSGRRVDSLQIYDNGLFDVAISTDGKLLASAGIDGLIRLWDLHDNVRLLHTLQGHTRLIRTVAFHPSEPQLASAGNDQVIRIWDVHTGQVLQLLAGHTDDVESLCFSPDGSRLISAGRDHTLRIWDPRSGQSRHTLQEYTDHIYACALRPDGRQVATCSPDRTICLWDLDAPPDQRLLRTLRKHGNGVRCVAYAPDGKLLISTGYDQTLYAWDPDSGEAIFSLHTENAVIWSMAFHPNGVLLAAGSSDHTVRLWDMHAQRLLITLRGHTNGVESVCFDADGKWLASAGYDGTIRLWDTSAALAATSGNVDSAAVCRHVLHMDGPYAGMNITGVEGISAAQKAALMVLGAHAEM